MKVLKFGGSSVANAQNIKKVTDIFQNSTYKNRVVIVSALSGVTDQMIHAGSLAASGKELYKDELIALEKKHMDTVKSLLPVTSQSSCLSTIKQYFNELEDICEGVYRLKELSARTKDSIVSFGELLSSKIISYYLQSLNVKHDWIDSREVIKTNSNFGFATVDFEITNQLIQQKIKSSSHILFIAPGFIASDTENHTTTLGRGGSDYTASIYAAALDA